MATEVWTTNAKRPARCYGRPYAITLSDTLTEKNLLYNGVVPYRWIQNAGTAGLVNIAWAPNDDLVAVYLAAGQVIPGGHWQHAKDDGTAAGVVLVGFLGTEGVDSDW